VFLVPRAHHAHAKPSDAKPSTPTPSPQAPSPPTPNQPPANPSAPRPGYGNLAPAYAVPAWYALLAQAQGAETRAADRDARYATRANLTNASPQQHHLAQGIELGN
jgi:hypothetical protein